MEFLRGLFLDLSYLLSACVLVFMVLTCRTKYWWLVPHVYIWSKDICEHGTQLQSALFWWGGGVVMFYMSSSSPLHFESHYV